MNQKNYYNLWNSIMKPPKEFTKRQERNAKSKKKLRINKGHTLRSLKVGVERGE